jgi:hypothetical protein
MAIGSSSARRKALTKALCRLLFSTTITLILLSYNLLAQSEIKIVGKVIDSVSGAPVSGAAVSIVDYGKLTVTDINGDFRFNDIPSGVYKLKTFRIGYIESAEVEISVNTYSTASAIIELTPKPLEVRGQVVSSDRETAFLVTRKGNLTVVEINGDGSASIDELPLQLPEIEIVESGPRKFLRADGQFDSNLAGRYIGDTFRIGVQDRDNHGGQSRLPGPGRKCEFYN